MTGETREKILAIAEERQVHLQLLTTKPSGLSWCVRHSGIADEVVRVLYDDVLGSHPDLPPLALVATGGYGRQELSPFSDIDITIVPSDEASPLLDKAIRILFQDIHWAFCTALHMDVGYAYRLISDAPGLDSRTQTGLMDMRLVTGSHELHRQLEEALIESFEVGEFVLAKVKEREEMFRKYHDTPLVIEPHLKEGAGGLRCFHCANWLRDAIGERSSRPTAEYDRILRYRNLLHLNAGKNQNVLSRQRQSQIADQLDLDVYQMMATIIEAGVALHAHYDSAREEITNSRFSLSRGVLAVHGEARIIGQADAGEAAVGIALATQLGLRVSDIEIGPTSGVRGPAALFAISTGEPTLRNLDRSGLLKQLLPELDACRTLVPTDSIHKFTVFEHTMRVVRALESLKPESFCAVLKDGISDREPLYLAALLHDVGKIDLDRDHSELGAVLANDVCERWNLDVEVRELVVWLVRQHLTMAKFINMRDIKSPRTVKEFAAIVGDLTKLTLLTVFTYADITSVGDSTWTLTQDSNIEELFGRTEALLRGDVQFSPDPAVYRGRLLRQLDTQKENETAVQAFVESLPAYYLTTTPTEVIRLHMGFARKAMEGTPTVELFNRSDLGVTEITVCTLDAPGLLSKILGVFYAFDLSVGEIRACTTMTEPAVALDVFTVSFSSRPVPTATMTQVSAGILDVLENRQEVEAMLLQRGKDPSRKLQIFKHAFLEGTPSILEISAPRGRGMPYRFSRLIADKGWNVVSARVGRWAGSATAAFYLNSSDGTAVPPEEIDDLIREFTVGA